MSGPKVVRIVTREEILAICESHLQRLAQASERWQAQAARLGELDHADVAATQARHQRLRQLLPDDELARLQREVPDEIEFLKRDLEAREERAVMKAAHRRLSARNLRENAATLIAALQSNSANADASLLGSLKAIAAGVANDDAESIVTAGFAGLRKSNDTEAMTESQRELAWSLQVDKPIRWDAQQSISREPRLERIDAHIARLQTLHGDAFAEPFLRRLDGIERETRPQQKSLLIDSLIIDLSSSVAELQARRDRLALLQDLAAELDALLGAAALSLLAEVKAASKDPSPDPQRVAELIGMCAEAIQVELRLRAAKARRTAVLEGLAALGYEVREGMETAWADLGRVVLRKPALPGYGVEIGGVAESGRLQVRAVSLSKSNDRARDRDIESIWCGEFGRLQSLLAIKGGGLVVEKALGVGEVPLKIVEMEEEDVGGRRSSSESST